MPNLKCGSSSLCLHGFVSSRDDEDNDFEFVEVDPSGRYGRYKEVLGKGACKTVYRAFDEVEGIEVAWNQVKVQDVLQTSEDLERLYSEVHLLKTLKHKNIIKLYHSWVDTKTKNVNFITEIFTSGTLRQYRKRHKHVDIKAVKNWSRQILRGLLYLHGHDPPIIHRDLKCDNIFVNGNQGEVKIGDLGLATILRHAHAAHSVIGTPEFMAPELYEEEYTELVDIYSFGMCLLEMVTSEYPYSECTNAAQIYKKVTSGKKPEALNKVKDPELRQFIDKCLTVASMRLSARELLMDPFLQTGGDRGTVGCLPVLSQVPTYTDTVTYTDDMDDLEVLMGLSHVKSASVRIRYRQNDTFSNVLDTSNHYMVPFPSAVGELQSSLGTDLSAAGSLCESMVWHHPKEGKVARSVDFRVKGKWGEDDTVFLRLRITDSEGCVQYINFPFYVEGDTAMCVASEMVAALDLTDQDVTKIAEMIDAAILAVVPEWKPGVAIDEVCCGEGEVFSDFGSVAAVEDGHSRICSVFDPLSTVSSESSLVEQSSHGLMLWCDPSTVITADAKSIPRVEGTLHGRFEEVTYHRRPDFPSCVAQEQCTFSSDSSGTLKVGDEWDPTEDSTSSASPVTNASVPEGESTAGRFDSSLSKNLSTDNKQGAAAFNELVESKRKAGLTNYRHETWKGIVSGRPYVDHQYASSIGIPVLQILEEDAFCQQDTKRHNFPQFLSAPPSVDMLPVLDDDDDNALIAQEIRQLSLRHEKELRELHRKHEEALLELRFRWWQKRSSSSPRNQQSNGGRREAQVGIPDLQGVVSNEFQAKECQDLAIHDALHQLAKRLSEDVSTETQSDSSLKGLSAALSHAEGLGSEGVGSLRNLLVKSDNISSMGKMCSSSALKVAEWVKGPSARGTKKNQQITSQSLFPPKTGKKSSYQSVAVRGQTYMKPEPGIVCIPVRPEAWEQIV